jgi:AcrR family transcriptional regulator
MRQQKPAGAKMPKQIGREESFSARERLLTVASDLFYRQGIRSVGIDQVIAEAKVAKMSLYRSFASKDELVAAYLRKRDELYWDWWDGVIAAHPESPREQLMALFRALATRKRPGSRGCPFTNAATEFPESDHPARRVAEKNKRELRRRLRNLAHTAGARHPDSLGDQFVLLFEGVYSSVQTFGAPNPAGHVVAAAEALMAYQLEGAATNSSRR